MIFIRDYSGNYTQRTADPIRLIQQHFQENALSQKGQASTIGTGSETSAPWSGTPTMQDIDKLLGMHPGRGPLNLCYSRESIEEISIESR